MSKYDSMEPTELVDTIDGASKALIRKPIPEGGEAADILGIVSAAATRITDWKRGFLAETSTPAVGKGYAFKSDGRKSTKSYSNAAIFSDVMEATDMDFLQTLFYLMDADRTTKGSVVKLEWRYTPLKMLFQHLNLTFREASKEIENDGDSDGPHVGSVWENKPMKLEGITE